MECHCCPHRADIDAGKYARTPFRRTPCAKCALKESSFKTLEFDVWRRDAGVGPEGMAATEVEAEGDGAEAMPVSVLTELAAALISLPSELRDVVCWRLAGWSYRKIGVAQGIGATAVEMRHQRAMKLCPCLWAAFARKMARHHKWRTNSERRPRALTGGNRR